MGKLRLSVHRNNEVHQRYDCMRYHVRIRRSAVSVMTVSIPLESLPFRVSLPLSLIATFPAISLSVLQLRIRNHKVLPPGDKTNSSL